MLNLYQVCMLSNEYAGHYWLEIAADNGLEAASFAGKKYPGDELSQVLRVCRIRPGVLDYDLDEV